MTEWNAAERRAMQHATYVPYVSIRCHLGLHKRCLCRRGGNAVIVTYLCVCRCHEPSR